MNWFKVEEEDIEKKNFDKVVKQVNKDVKALKKKRFNMDSEKIDKLIRLGKLQIGKMAINKLIYEFKYEISILNIKEDEINNEIKEIEKEMIDTKMFNIPSDRLPIISFPFREYYVKDQTIISYNDFPKFNDKFLSVMGAIFLYILLN